MIIAIDARQLTKKKYEPGSREMAGWILLMGSVSQMDFSVSVSEILKMNKDSVIFGFYLSRLIDLYVGESRAGSVVRNDCVAAA
ncbi:hypothetical protein SLA2020_364670 [Shorea laevis]